MARTESSLTRMVAKSPIAPVGERRNGLRRPGHRPIERRDAHPDDL
jgi:hypothetical protein